MYLYKTLTQAIAYNVVKEYDKSYRTIGSEGVCLCLMDKDEIIIEEHNVLERFELEGVVYIKFDVKKFFKENPERHDYEELDWMPETVWVATETKPVVKTLLKNSRVVHARLGKIVGFIDNGKTALVKYDKKPKQRLFYSSSGGVRGPTYAISVEELSFSTKPVVYEKTVKFKVGDKVRRIDGEDINMIGEVVSKDNTDKENPVICVMWHDIQTQECYDPGELVKV